MINQEKMEKALDYLASTDEEYARLKALADGLKEQQKVVHSNLFLRMDGTQGERGHKATAHSDYAIHLGKWQSAVMDFETLKAKRITATLIIDCWRSLNAARQKGFVV